MIAPVTPAELQSARPYRGHPRNGLLLAALHSGHCSGSEIPNYRYNKISFKIKYLLFLPMWAALGLQIATSNTRRGDFAERLTLERQLKGKARRRKK